MSERDQNQDPIDKAYGEAEALLNDEAARAARRAKLLAAVAAEAEPVVEASRRRPWPRAIWLTAASIAGVALVVASQSHLTDPFRLPAPPPSATPQPPPAQGPTVPLSATPPPVLDQRQQVPAIPLRAPAAPLAEPAPSSRPSAAAVPEAFPASAGPPPATLPVRPSYRAAPRDIAPSPPMVQQREVVPAPEPGPPSPPPPPIQVKPAEKAIAPPPPRVVVMPPPRPSVPSDGLAAAQEDAARSPGDPALRLRAAAAAGRTAEVEALLAQGARIDTPDGEGDTALMKSIQAGHPDVAAVLRRRGASLEVKNRAGQSARDMAAAIGDAKLNQALGLTAPSTTAAP